jgi:hypothetical protein
MAAHRDPGSHNTKVAPKKAYTVRRCVFRSGGTKLLVHGDEQPDQVEVHNCGRAVTPSRSLLELLGIVVRMFKNGQLIDTIQQ